jgi:hypothetical protein
MRASQTPSRFTLTRLSAKGSEQRSEGAFGHYEGPKLVTRVILGALEDNATGVSETFRTVSPRTRVNRPSLEASGTRTSTSGRCHLQAFADPRRTP